MTNKKLKNITSKIKNGVVGFFVGTRKTEEEVFTQQGSSSDDSVKVGEVMQAQNLADALLKGIVTEEVKELRYRDYKVSNEAKNFQILPNGVAYRADAVSFAKSHVDKSDGYPIQLIQNNNMVKNSVDDEMNRLGTYGKTQRYTLKCYRNVSTRYRLEEFVTKIVVKRISNQECLVDLYTTIYPDKLSPIKHNGFLTEIKRIKEEPAMAPLSDVFNIESMNFVTDRAYGCSDRLEFEFDDIKFYGIVEFDGYYVIKLKCHVKKDGEDLTAKYYNKNMDEEYKNKTPRTDTLKIKVDENPMSKKTNLLEGDEEEVCYCADCGKEINVLDARIIEATYGRPLCNACLKKMMEINSLI